MTGYQWTPTAGYIEEANVTRLARAHGLAGIDELRARSIADTAWYWDAAATDLGLRFRTPYSRVLSLHNGIEHPDWFVGATMNIVDSCLLRWAEETPDGVAVSHEDEAGRIREISFSELATEVARAADGLRQLGIGAGDAVAIYLPMIPEAVVACYAVAALGAILVPLFSGFASSAIASRLADAEAKAVICADLTTRRGRAVPLLPQISQALAHCPTLQHVIVVPNESEDGQAGPPQYVGARMVLWSQLIYRDAPLAPVEVDAMHPLLLAYTSGTTGKPKGAVHTHAGFLVKTASEVAYSFDLKPGGVFCWVTDMGWIMGPLSVFGTHANGATLLLYEGSPDRPDISRLWRLVERHRVTMLGVSPTLVRALRTAEFDHLPDLSSVHVLGSTGEPWDPESYEWLARDVFGGRVPVINFSGGTEIGGSFLAPYPVEPIRSCSLGGPSLGMDVDVVDDSGQSVRGQVGELVCRQPWPSMTRGVWKDDERYLQAYWSRFPGIWTHGDFALADDDGQWFIRGRSDDVMNVAGKRLAPAEVESVMITHPQVAEAAAVGVPDSVKGEAVWGFWVPRPGGATEIDAATADRVGAELAALVGRELGKPFTPSRVWQVAALPKTRSAKIMRRAIRAAAIGIDPGDLSGAENPDAVGEIRRVVADKEKHPPMSEPTMTTSLRRVGIPALSLLATGAVAAAVALAWRASVRPRATALPLELTPHHRGGTGSPLLLLHGVTGIWRVWSPVLPYLEPHHDVIAPTLSCHGGGPPLNPDTAPSVQALADGIEEFLDSLGLPTVHIAGNSLGGWVGIELARRGRARSLVVFSPAGAWRSQRATELRAVGIQLLVASMRMCTSRADAIAANAVLRRMMLAAQVAHPDRISPAEVVAWLQGLGVAPSLIPLLRAIPRVQVQHLPAERAYPVRLVWGDRDRVLPFDESSSIMLERLPGAEFVRLHGAGHVPMSDDPAGVADLILEVSAAVDGGDVNRVS